MNDYDHSLFESELGIPESIAHLLDRLHESTSESVWPTFSLRFLEAVNTGADLSKVPNQINLFILKRNKTRVSGLEIDQKIKTQVLAANDQCIDLHEGVLSGVIAASAARSAARSAESAAESAALSAAESAALSSARSAAESAAWSARSAASAASAASAEYDLIAEELIRLLRAAK